MKRNTYVEIQTWRFSHPVPHYSWAGISGFDPRGSILTVTDDGSELLVPRPPIRHRENGASAGQPRHALTQAFLAIFPRSKFSNIQNLHLGIVFACKTKILEGIAPTLSR